VSAAIALVDCGRGNLRSVERALIAAGGEPVRTSDPEIVRRAAKVVVPGQGAFADAMASLRETGLDQVIHEVISAGRPYFGICLGLQLLFEESDEHGPVAGLGILPGRVERLVNGGDAALKIPHIGWNSVDQLAPDPLVDDLAGGEHFYFIHSYAVVPADRSSVVLECNYGAPFTAAIRAGNVFACQFHPEKSQRLGIELLRRFVEARS
jgi:glutamine amidotransferase